MSQRATGAAKTAPAPRKSGANIPDSQRHTVKLQLRVQAEISVKLDALCGDTWTRSDYVSMLIAARKPKAKP